MCEKGAEERKKRMNSTQSKKVAAVELTPPRRSRESRITRLSPAFLSWRPTPALRIARAHPFLVLLFLSFGLVIPLEYSLAMVAPGGQPFDAGFVATEWLHKLLKQKPALNHVLAAANTVLVVYQIAYIVWVWVWEGRFRATLAALFMFSSRGLLGYCTQLPLPQDFLGSEVDFPVGNVSFFLFFSGHVGASIIASLDLRHMSRKRGALIMDTLNVLQTARLLATRGHYTIDLVAGVFAGWGSYYVAGIYEDTMNSTGAYGVWVAPKADLKHLDPEFSLTDH